MHLIGTPREQCPLDFPHAFSDGRRCCLNDKESHFDENGNYIGHENPLTFSSLTCKEHSEVACNKERCISNGEIFELLLTLLQVKFNVIRYFQTQTWL